MRGRVSRDIFEIDRWGCRGPCNACRCELVGVAPVRSVVRGDLVADWTRFLHDFGCNLWGFASLRVISHHDGVAMIEFT